MFRKIENHKYTAAITPGNRVIVSYDDGFETILSYYMDCNSRAEAEAHLIEGGFEEYDPNAELKAAGFVWNGYIYAKP